MKKNFPLQLPGKADPRVVEGIKGDIRHYVKRERRKAIPAGVDFWDFNCKVGLTQDTAVSRLITEINRAIDEIAAGGALSVYVEVLATPGHRIFLPITPAATLPSDIPTALAVPSETTASELPPTEDTTAPAA